jgi:tetratricopeptide (TPR) repeat protein
MAKKRKNPTRREVEALDRAQELVDMAREASSAKRSAELAMEAIRLSPICADAWSVLAAIAEPGSDQQLQCLTQAIDAGEAAIGASFEEMVGHFWGWPETRPYMRAKGFLAGALWRRGQRDEAIAVLRDMLRLNPGDNQGMRYTLMGYLSEIGDLAGIEALAADYPDEEGAMWFWPIALGSFRRHGDSDASRKALRAALRGNKHVAPLLLGTKKLPKVMPDFHGIGDQNEAVLYAAEFTSGWQSTPGAIDWLRAATSGAASSRGNRK